METPRIYGDESRFRAAVTRAINSGEDLLAQVEGVRKLMRAAGDNRMEAYAIERGWEEEFRAWFNRTGKGLHKYLREQLIGVPRGMRLPPPGEDEPELMPTLGAGIPPDTGKPRHVIHIDEGEEWLRRTLAELRDLQSVVAPPPKAKPPRRQSAMEIVAPPTRWSWLRPSWWKLGTAGSVASLVGVPLAIAGIVLAILLR